VQNGLHAHQSSGHHVLLVITHLLFSTCSMQKFKGYKIVGLFRVYVPAELSVSPCVLDSHRYRVLRYLRNRTRIENMTK
jgi:hypothetical protein